MEKVIESERPEVAPYSIYTTPEKYVIIIAVSCVAFFSTVSSPVYLPILPLMERKFHTSEENMNVSVVVYSIFQGVSPTLFSNLADRFGRRIVIMACLVIYILANVGLALNNTYAGLLCLRSLQAFGIASTISIASGVVGDLNMKRERGRYMGIYTSVSNMGHALGALVGGATEAQFNWRAIFWMLAIVSGCVLVVFFFVVPETARSQVGNGSSFPRRFELVSICPLLRIPAFNRGRITKEESSTVEPRKRFDLIAPLKIIANQDVALVLIPSSVSYAMWLMALTTLSISLQKSYGWTSSIKVGLTYIPSGVGGMVGPMAFGRLLDFNYKRHYARFVAENESRGIQRSPREFDVMRSRIEVFVGPLLLCICGGLLFGWSVDKKVSVAAVLVGSCIISMGSMSFMTVSTTILVDAFPGNTSAAVASLNLTRCLTAAVGLAVLSLMTHRMTVGGCYTFTVGMTLLSSGTLVYLYVRSNHFLQKRLLSL